MNREMTPKRVLLLIAVLLAVAALLGFSLLRRDGGSAVPSAGAESSAQESAAAPEPETSASGADASVSGAEISAPGQEKTEKSASAARSVGAVSGGVPASPLAPEGDPYPGLYVESAEKTDDNTQKIVYLTFDDGPSDNTDKILEILDRLDVKATFFVTAQYGTPEERAERCRSILEKGHTLGLHTYSHSYEKIYASVDSYLEDLNRINEEVYAATGYRASLIRFPGGSSNRYNEKVCRELTAEVERRGYTYHDWAVSCGDAEGKKLSAGQVIRETADECEKRSKSVVLFHDTPVQTTTVEALEGLIRELREKGYELRALDNTIRPFQFVKTE